MASGLVSAGVTPAELEKLAGHLSAAIFGDVLGWLSAAISADGLLQEIDLATRRISELVGAVKQYTYMDQGGEQAVAINRDLENTLTVMNYKLKRGVTVIREYDPTLPKIMAQGGELNQVWTNLIANALEAMEYNGTLKVITRNEQDFVMIEIADTGPGIPPLIQPRIFDPFFTTKAVGAAQAQVWAWTSLIGLLSSTTARSKSTHSQATPGLLYAYRPGQDSGKRRRGSPVWLPWATTLGRPYAGRQAVGAGHDTPNVAQRRDNTP